MPIKGLHVAIFIIIIQWVVMSLTVAYFQTKRTESSSLKPFLPKKIEENKQLKHEFNGVSVTLLIGSPKWFSRRFSIMINNMLTAVPSDSWGVQIFVTGQGTSKEGIDINIGLQRLIASSHGRVFLTMIPAEKVKLYGKKRYLYLTDPWFWNSIVADKVLMFSGNGAFCANSHHTIHDFLHYDYIGIPWNYHGRLGGGGEYSIRSRRAMLAALQFQAHNGNDKDDFFFVKTLLDMNKQNHDGNSFKIASAGDTQRFAGTKNFTEMFHTYKTTKSWEVVGPPFVVQGTLPNLEHEIREAFLALCPELKTIFPVLHSPHCFGAHPKAEECAKSICALQDNKSGGC